MRKSESGGHNRKKDQHFNLQEIITIRKDTTQSWRHLVRRNGVSFMTVQKSVKNDLKMESYVKNVTHIVVSGQKVRRLEHNLENGPGIIFYTDKKNCTQDASTSRRNERILFSDVHESNKNGTFKCKNSAKVILCYFFCLCGLWL